MTFKHKLSVRLALLKGALCAGALALASCGEGLAPPEQEAGIEDIQVLLADDELTLEVGERHPLATVVQDGSGTPLTDEPLRWSSSDSTVAMVDDSGTVVAMSVGTAQVKAESGRPDQANGWGRGGRKAADSTVIIVTPPHVASVDVQPDSTALTAGDTTVLTVTARDQYDDILTDRVAAWSSTDDAVVTVDANGRAIAGAEGVAHVVAVVDGVADSAKVSVAPAPVHSVTVQPATLTMAPGASQTLTVEVRDAAGGLLTGRTVSWSSGTPTVATVNGSGRVTAVAAGSATITATSEGTSGSARVTVETTTVPVARVDVTPAADTLLVGATLQLAATASDANGATLGGRTFVWVSRAADVATVSSGGVVTGVAAGTAYVVATSEGKTDSARITVEAPPAPVASVAVTPPSDTIAVGATTQLSAVARDANGTALSGRTIAWSSRNSGIASVSSAGLVTGAAGGTTYVVATSEGKSDSARVTVEPPPPAPVASVTVTPVSDTIAAGATTQLSAVAKDAAGATLSGRSFTWTTRNASIATVSSAGRVTGVAAGTVYVLATSEGKSDSARVTVEPPPPAPVASVTVTPASASVPTGQAVQLTATLQDGAGNPLTGRSVSWTSSAPLVASVSGSGLVTGLAAGTATITATSEGKSGTAAVTVTAPAPTVRTGYYAAPNGSSGGTGSYSQPWDLVTALSGGNGKIRAGDTLWVRGGTYRGAFRSTLAGTSGAPVVVRGYPGERAVIDGAGQGTSSTFIVKGAWAVYWGLEFTNSDGNRFIDRPNTVVNDASNTKYVNLVVHDGSVGFYNYTDQRNVEVYGSIFYNIGWQGTDRGHGHALYVKSSSGPVLLQDNVMFNQFGYGVHLYTNAGSGYNNNIRVEGNVAFNNGTLSSNSTSANMLIGGDEPVSGSVVTNNLTYFSPGVAGDNLKVGYGSTRNQDVTLQGNYAVGGSTVLDLGYWTSAAISGNTFVAASRVVELQNASTAGHVFGANVHRRDPASSSWRYNGASYSFSGWKAAAGVGATDQAASGTPTGPQVVVRPNLYEPGRATVTVYNWGGQGAISVSLAGLLPTGATYEVRSVQNLFGAPLASGTFGGGSLTIPLTAVQPSTPVGMSSSRSPTTGPDFDVFVITTR